jgi:hypothetical protein
MTPIGKRVGLMFLTYYGAQPLTHMSIAGDSTIRVLLTRILTAARIEPFRGVVQKRPTPGLAETAVATTVAFALALAVIAFLMNCISKHSFLPFVVYRLLLGGTLLVLLSIGILKPY